MRLFERWKPTWTIVCVGLACGTAADAAAQDGAAAKPPAAAVAKAEPIVIPSGTPAELLEFIDKTKKLQPPGRDLPAVVAHLNRVYEAVAAAVDKIGTAGTEEEQTRAIGEKLAALRMLRRVEAAGATERMKKYHNDLLADKRPFVPPLAKIYELATRLQEIDRGNLPVVEKLVAEVRQHVRTAKLDSRNLSLAFQTALLAESVGLTKQAAEAYIEFAAAFATSDEPAVVENSKRLAGAARLLSLPGQAMDVAAKTVEGKPFDLKELKGKVVLVDFWATWCGPCMAELPTLKDCYAKYHGRGFEVVGISLDDNRSRLVDFLKREELPWITLFDDTTKDAAAKSGGWDQPLALQYGIMSIPRAILIDRTGKVVSLHAHGDALWDLLAEQIGPAEPKKKEPAEETEKKKDDKPAEAPKATGAE
ncbi:MAG: TlpA family protein disulfide reductase [Planctomycetia bacterium]|nr:TlpA family protein disulfide reductase [Planctomycetia bacterium]